MMMMRRTGAVGLTALLLLLGGDALAGPGDKPKTPAPKPEKKDVKKDAKDAKKDAPAESNEPPTPKKVNTPFDDAVDFYREQEKTGWTLDKCQAAAGRFEDVAKGKVVQAYYNAGVSMARCGKLDDAEKFYKKALSINPNHAPSMANLGEIAYRRGKKPEAEQTFEKAKTADTTLEMSGARNNLAWFKYQQLTQTTDEKQRKALEADALHLIQGALAVDTQNVYSYVLMGLIYLEGSERNRNRLDVAKLLLDKGAEANPNYAPLHNAYGLLYMRSHNVTKALDSFKKAASLDPKFFEAHMNWGQIVLSNRNYEEAEAQFREALKVNPKSYAATIGLGVSLRGEGTVLRSNGKLPEFAAKIDEAEKTYKDALALDKNQGDAMFNLGLLYMDYRTNEADQAKNIQQYQKAKQYFQDFLAKVDKNHPKRETAQGHIQACDNSIAAVTKALQASSAPPAPSPAPQK